MKIVGTTDTGFLAQITLEEIGMITGFGRHALYGDTGTKFKIAIGLDDRHNITTGTEIKITTGFDYLTTLSESQTKAMACAETLRQIADLITTNLPKTVLPELSEGPAT